MTEDKLHLKNTSRMQNQTLESYEMLNPAWIFIFLSHFNYNYIAPLQASFPPLLVGRLGLIIIHNCLCEKRMCPESHIYCRKGRQELPPWILTNFTNNEETENMCGGENQFFWFSKLCFSSFRTASATFKWLIYSSSVLSSSSFGTWIGWKAQTEMFWEGRVNEHKLHI